MTKNVTRRPTKPETDYYSVNSKWFTDRMHDLGLIRDDVAKRFDTYPIMISRMTLGTRPIRVGEIPIWAEILKVSPVEVLRHLGVEVPPERCPVAGTIGKGGAVTYEPAGSDRTTEAPGGSDHGLVAYGIDSPDRELDIYRHGYLFVSPREIVGPDCVLRLCVLRLAGRGGGLVGRILKAGPESEKGISARVETWGPGEPRDVDRIVSASPVMWSRLV